MVALTTLVTALAFSAGGETVLLDFYSDTCMPCRMMDPVVQQLAAGGAPVRRVNVAQQPDLANRFRVTGVPCFVMLVNGQEVDRQVGSTSAGRLQQMLARGQSAAPPAAVAAGPRTEAVPIPGAPSGRAFTDIQRGPEVDASQSAAPPGWRNNGPQWSPSADPTVSPDALLAASVRIRVDNGSSQSCGSGTAVDARNGKVLIVTCGHLFRESRGQGRITVDLFGPAHAEQAPAQLIHYDLDRDVALIAATFSGPVAAVRVAPPEHRLAKGARVFNVGCNGGDDPTVRQGVVTSVDRFSAPPNLTVTGMPVEGRSGGGLFSADGQLIGVCNAALQQENEGYYAALASIHAELDGANMSFVYRDPPARSDGAMVAVTPTMPRQMPPPSNLSKLTDLPQPTAQAPRPMSAQEQAAIEELQRRRAAGDEVLIIVRPKNNPQGKSEIMVLDGASPAFFDQLGPRPAAIPAAPAAAVPSPAAAPPAAPQDDLTRSSAALAPEWKPRWLQPGYHGE